MRDIKSKWFGKILLVISFIFIGIQLKNFNINLRTYIFSKSLLLLAVSMLLLMLSIYMCATGWRKVLEVLSDEEIPVSFVNNIYVKSNLAKYVPGNIMQFVGRGVLSSKFKINAKKITLSVFYELLLLAMIGGLIILLTNQFSTIIKFIPTTYKRIVFTGLWLGVLLAMGIIGLKRQLIRKICVPHISEAFKVIKNAIIFYLLALILMGISFVIVITTLCDYTIETYIFLQSIGAFILAWFVGFITPGVPGGIGIRETVLITYLGMIIPSNFILEAVIIHRIVNICADIAMYVVYIYIGEKGKVHMNIVQPEGNYFNKYGSNNKIVIKLMTGFFHALDSILDKIQFKDVIEAGCGEGKITNHIYKKYDCNVIGFDIGTEAIKKAKEEFEDISFAVKSIYDTKISDNRYDLVVCCEVLEHLEEYDDAIEELFRISNKYVLVSVPKEPIWRVLNLCRFKYVMDLGNTPGHINHWSKRSFIKLLSKYGNILEVRTPLPWTMILLEKEKK